MVKFLTTSITPSFDCSVSVFVLNVQRCQIFDIVEHPHVDKLSKRGVVTVTKFLVTVTIANSVGAVNETTLYDLTVFNYLVMRLGTSHLPHTY